MDTVQCWRCDDHRFICDICGEPQGSCDCIDATFHPCPDCMGDHDTGGGPVG